MKYFEYGVVRYGGSGEETNVFRRNTKKNQLESIMSQLSDKGNMGWEVYQVIESPDGMTHFLMKREISKDYAEEMHRTKYTEKYSDDFTKNLGVAIKNQGFVDSVGPDSQTWK